MRVPHYTALAYICVVLYHSYTIHDRWLSRDRATARAGAMLQYVLNILENATAAKASSTYRAVFQSLIFQMLMVIKDIHHIAHFSWKYIPLCEFNNIISGNSIAS